MPDVVVEVELGVVDPYRPALSERDEPELLAKPGHQMEPRRQVVTELLVARGGTLEHGRRGDVHVHRTGLEVQKRGVEAAEPVPVRHAQIISEPGRREGVVSQSGRSWVTPLGRGGGVGALREGKWGWRGAEKGIE